MTNEPFWTITAGNVVTVLGGLVTLAGLWWKTAQLAQTMQDKLSEVSSRVEKTESTMDQLTNMGLMTTVAQHERRLVDMERQVSSLGRMENDIAWIKEKLRTGVN